MLEKCSFLNIESFQSFILQWNIENPVDRWWRTKHAVPFNSPTHRQMSFLDMYWEFYEDYLYQKIQDKQNSSKYIPNQNDFIDGSKRGVDSITEEEFDSIEI